jgi:hypothetical protein
MTGKAACLPTPTITPETSESEYDSDKPDENDVNSVTALPSAQRDVDSNDHEEEDTTDIPEEFICPLTLEIFTDPLMDRRGINFERSAIVEWLNRGNETCPLTREPLGYRSLIPNVNLRARVEHWKREHGYRVEPRSVQKEKERLHFVATVVAPLRGPLQLRWDEDWTNSYARTIAGQIDVTNEESQDINYASNSRRRPRHRNSTPRMGPSGYSPTTRQRRLVGMLGEALNIVRRPPLAGSSDES